MSNFNFINLGKNLLLINMRAMRIINNCVYGRSHAGMLECMPPRVYEERLNLIDNLLKNYLIKLNKLGLRGADMRGHGSVYVNDVHMLMCGTLVHARNELKKYEKYYNKHKI